MTLQNRRELEVTREKLRSLEYRYQAIAERPSDDENVRELTLRSFRALINQLKEEIALFESHTSVTSGGTS